MNRYCEFRILTIDRADAEAGCDWAKELVLFVGSKQGGQLAAILFSLVQICKRLEVEPWAFLKDLFGRLPMLGE